jgi:hypothetical protein
MRFNQKDLGSIAKECAIKIQNAVENGGYFREPFQHIVIDNFLPINMANACGNAFPAINDDVWDHQNDGDIEIKSRTNWQSEFDAPDGIVDAIRVLNSSLVLKALSDSMAIPKVIPDPYYTGGGLNVTRRGGLLDVHVDGNYHDATGLNRRLNLLIYFTKDWQEHWGGEFGLYDRKGIECLKKVPPLFNRCVIFDSHDYSFHGLPDPINFPEGIDRKSIILYYYTVARRPDNQISSDKPHSALWVKRGLNDKRGNKDRNFY